MTAHTVFIVLLCVFSTQCQNLRLSPDQYVKIPSCACNVTNLVQPELDGWLFLPAGFKTDGTSGPIPLVVILHGHTGLWSTGSTPNCDSSRRRTYYNTNWGQNVSVIKCPNATMQNNFQWWAQQLPSTTYLNQPVAALFLDSFGARNIVELDDDSRPNNVTAGCLGFPVNDYNISSASARPCDAFCTLRWVNTLSWVNPSKVALLGFSHGGETAISVSLDTTINRTVWNVSTLINQATGALAYTRRDPPPRLRFPNSLSFAVTIAYYPGTRFYCYYSKGSCADNSANNFMTRWPTLMLHGTSDSLSTTAQSLIDKSVAHWISLQNTTVFPADRIVSQKYDYATHSFDLYPQSNYDTVWNKQAQESARIKVKEWLNQYLGLDPTPEGQF